MCRLSVFALVLAVAIPSARGFAEPGATAVPPASAPATRPRPNLLFRDFPPLFADGECLQGLPRPVVLTPKPGFARSDRPLLFDMTHTPMPTRLLLDEAGGPGSGYDTLYLDFDRDGEFTDDPAYKAVPREPAPMYSDGRPVVIYFRDVHIPRSGRQEASSYVQIPIETLEGWPQDVTALHPRIVPQRWAVGHVTLEGRRIPAAIVDRGWDDSWTRRQGISPTNPKRYPNGDCLILGVEGEQELMPGRMDGTGGSARVVLNDYLSVDEKVYRVELQRLPEGIHLNLVPTQVPMATLVLPADAPRGHLILVGTRTSAIVRDPREPVRLPVDTYLAPHFNQAVYTVGERPAASQPVNPERARS